MDAANLLKPMLARGELRCIGATTVDEPLGSEGRREGWVGGGGGGQGRGGEGWRG